MKREQNKYIFIPDTRKSRRKHHFLRNTVVILLLLAASFVITNAIVSRKVTVRDQWLTVLNLPEDLEQYSILHISDLHGAEFGEKQKAIANELANRRYSCVIMTGDMLGENGEMQPLLDLIALMPAETPKYFVPGDTEGSVVDATAHGSLSVYADWVVTLQDAGVTILDRPMSETRGKGTIRFVPEELYSLDIDAMMDVYNEQLKALRERATDLNADDAARMRVLEYEMTRLEEVRQARKEFTAGDIQIVVTHTPLSEDYVRELVSWSGKEDYFSLRYASLILAGHYNGGQWRIPGVGAIYVPELGWFPKDSEVRGVSYPDGIPQHISPGLGSDPHYEKQSGRVYNPPEITLITLTRNAVQ